MSRVGVLGRVDNKSTYLCHQHHCPDMSIYVPGVLLVVLLSVGLMDKTSLFYYRMYFDQFRKGAGLGWLS